MKITYHKAAPEDIELLIDLRIQFALELSGPQPEEKIQHLKREMRHYFKRAIPENSCISFIARCDGAVAGNGSVQIREQPGNFKNPSGKWGYIMSMYTLSGFRRKGICKAILDLLIAEAGKQGVTAFELHATKEGEPVYKNNGFDYHIEPTLRKYVE